MLDSKGLPSRTPYKRILPNPFDNPQTGDCNSQPDTSSSYGCPPCALQSRDSSSSPSPCLARSALRPNILCNGRIFESSYCCRSIGNSLVCPDNIQGSTSHSRGKRVEFPGSWKVELSSIICGAHITAVLIKQPNLTDVTLSQLLIGKYNRKHTQRNETHLQIMKAFAINAG